MFQQILLLFFIFSKETKYGSHTIDKNTKLNKNELISKYGTPLISFQNSIFYSYKIINTGVFFDSTKESAIIKFKFNANDKLVKTTVVKEKNYIHTKKEAKKPNITPKTFLENIFGSITKINLEKSFT